VDKQQVNVNYRLLWAVVLILIIVGMLVTTVFA
jgi:hypothetical protein